MMRTELVWKDFREDIKIDLVLNNVNIRKLIEAIIAIILLPIGIVIVSPFLILISFETRSSPIFIQKRVGERGNHFNIKKLKTMFDGEKIITKSRKETADGNQDDETPLGKWLRLTRIDEIPQLINIIMGEMSFFGYRPLIDNHVYFIYNSTPGIFSPGRLFSFFNNDEQIDDKKLQYIDWWYYSEGNETFFWNIYIAMRVIIILSSRLMKKLKKSLKIIRDFLISTIFVNY